MGDPPECVPCRIFRVWGHCILHPKAELSKYNAPSFQKLWFINLVWQQKNNQNTQADYSIHLRCLIRFLFLFVQEDNVTYQMSYLCVSLCSIVAPVSSPGPLCPCIFHSRSPVSSFWKGLVEVISINLWQNMKSEFSAGCRSLFSTLMYLDLSGSTVIYWNEVECEVDGLQAAVGTVVLQSYTVNT